MMGGEPDDEDDDYAEDDDDDGDCHWCQGSGRVAVAMAYVAGPDPFSGPVNTVTLPTLCEHCRGTGTYESALDPTLWDR